MTMLGLAEELSLALAFRHKTNITFNNNDTVSFLEYRNFQFQPSMSHGSESDYIVMPNILVLVRLPRGPRRLAPWPRPLSLLPPAPRTESSPRGACDTGPLALQGAAVMMEDKPMSLKLIMTLAFSTLGERAFMNRTVGEIMWGYSDPLVNLINKYFPGTFPFKDKFGLFAELNNSNSGLFTVFTGVQNISRIHLVDKWNGLSKEVPADFRSEGRAQLCPTSHLFTTPLARFRLQIRVAFWHSDQCNMINGTSGQMWPPFMTPESSLEFYSPEACR
ncbi:Scavenger receptor class B member 1 [Saguinus oedipus]|uniref:Scavenger receptor class B member 1 n=1 Tax=Saguinus oedipus TaxID=9490 RepID=A0ABQ9V2H0_SAGOE|nr:Scavenger receptor class B member 1 [Saguinus oedipus]